MPVTLEFCDQISKIEKTSWQEVISTDYPFLQYDYLIALEESQSVSAEAGWQPYHLIIKDNQVIKGVMPSYIKSHSYGEYVFDFQWANAYHQAGKSYYPKLVSAIPFTPATGPRLSLDSMLNSSKIIIELKSSLEKLNRDKGLSSWHLLFPDFKLNEKMIDNGVFSRSGIQYHWLNNNYTDFGDFLRSCKLKKRKNIKRERRCLAENSLTVRWITGEQLTAEVWRQFYYMYQLTYIKRSGHGGYLTEEFFKLLSHSDELNVLLIGAFENDRMIAASLFFHDHQSLFGRYWGCIKEFEFLHFELCYYQGIEFAIHKRLYKFDAGAQGDHKIARGFQPIETFSNHWIAEPAFSEAIENFVFEETKLVKNVILEARTGLPFK